MHVFIGGAYNGKTDYVMGLYKERQVALVDGNLPEIAPACEVLVIRNLENWLMTQNLEDDDQVVQAVLATFRRLEQHCMLALIVNDMGRGVVPIDKQARLLRDTCGRLYQALFIEAEQVVRIWYGLAEQLK
ncbi:bifunctional adenosylcobinamide kinase/adenosylcobinamide-phosphate guanylyltransferase [Lysinibacillus irui]|uniref:Bifunctional adenosylcobinamide kinase/adenosylcobinamide-phosphate guanylyltransferase n=1 Tax=Lysinibacillus irui TaxID=2998077 RepID=A0AAJ5RLJ8_9BACI|nr:MULTISPECIES: bifunctional adenosylcobinamide kinase/adenosylcobinamide-phosphate guanylyltransferase [Lysinibacillus]MEA0555234.1 bifunctional adenosylcobinamide kinase/adenosylcobinamide-phosphate guanylyltransferase [Lysinibacillus irui]MEA0562197.1 bifunctional adenosylcobinamide kinase/adenosylcobinamide-phosphate guanylyltransferase [Lysinibacillus irui]MEA0977757.1 bifunctional adenosylcobinamide kinase/adenosylcobinamide-phosphate guanylyltransferase [Lysinibacillus irui]MEA1043911.1